jgi:thiol:disulfide interchange protein DsbD
MINCDKIFAQPSPLPADSAFRFTGAHIQNNSIITSWIVAPEYYLYANKFQFKLIDASHIKLGPPQFPDQFFYKVYPTGEKMKAFTGQFNIVLPLQSTQTSQNKLKLEVRYQGCSELGICYPEQIKNATINLTDKTTLITTTAATTSSESDQNKIMQTLKDKKLFSIIGVFFLLGLLLSLTPCVLPMIPILSSIILGQKTISHARSFALSFIYVFAMSLTYAVLGIIIGLIGGRIQAFLQNPWVIGIFSLIFIAMALSLFGFFSVQLPETLRRKIAKLSNEQKHGSFLGTAVMGCLSTLILSPCVTPPLAGAIIYIGDTGNALLGACALFFMGLGMGVPLLIIGASSAKLLPKAGHWMNVIKCILGVMMLGVAIWLLSRILPGQITMILWAILAIGCAIAMRTFTNVQTPSQWVSKLFGILIFVYGVILLIGALLGQTNPLNPIPIKQIQQNNLTFIQVNSLAELNTQLENAKSLNKPAMLDFYATWCVSCRQMDAYTFSDSKVKELLQNFVLLRTDVTTSTPSNQKLEKKLKVVAPPTLIFFNREGKEVKSARIVGEIAAKRLAEQLSALLNRKE